MWVIYVLNIANNVPDSIGTLPIFLGEIKTETVTIFVDHKCFKGLFIEGSKIRNLRR